MYAELSYFDGYHFQHIAAWEEQRRLARLHDLARRAIQRTKTRSRSDALDGVRHSEPILEEGPGSLR